MDSILKTIIDVANATGFSIVLIFSNNIEAFIAPPDGDKLWFPKSFSSNVTAEEVKDALLYSIAEYKERLKQEE